MNSKKTEIQNLPKENFELQSRLNNLSDLLCFEQLGLKLDKDLTKFKAEL